MGKFIDRMPTLLDQYSGYVAASRLGIDDLDRSFQARVNCTCSLSSELRFIGVAGFVLHGDLESFRRNLRESAELQLQLCEWSAEGKPVAPSLVSLSAMKSVFDALATGAFDIAIGISEKISEEKGTSPIHRFLGLPLKCFVLEDKENMLPATERLADEATKKKLEKFSGYARVFEAMLAKDEAAIEAGFKELLEGHRKLSKSYAFFKDSEDELLCVWGLGMLNLCRWKGFDVSVDDPLIPKGLMVPVS